MEIFQASLIQIVVSFFVSAAVSLSVIFISRCLFSRDDRRFPIIVALQKELFDKIKDPPWNANGGMLHFSRFQEMVDEVKPLLHQLKLVSSPKKIAMSKRHSGD